MKKLVILSVVILSLAFAMCGDEYGSEQNDVFDRSSVLIGIAMPENYVRWPRDGEEIKNAALALGYKAVLVNADGSQDTQNAQIKSLIDEGAKLIIVANIDSGINPAITEAKKAGVIIIAYDRLIQGTGDYNYYITFNNYEVGQMQGRAIIDALDLTTQKNIVLFAGSPADKNADFFFSGAMDVLQQYINSEKLNVLGGTSLSEVGIPGWSLNNADSRINALFDGTTPIHAILAPNDSCARYIIGKYEEKYSSGPFPLVTGQDAEFDSAMFIKNGKQLMTVFKNTSALAANAVKLADQLLEQKTVSIPGTVLAAGKLAEMGDTGVKKVTTFLMEPALINKDNLGDLIGIGWFTQEQEDQLE
ncbi:MAG: sugar-binding protein [Treponema sp.]|nr:sugar-binding protein [Treponema sp.]